MDYDYCGDGVRRGELVVYFSSRVSRLLTRRQSGRGEPSWESSLPTPRHPGGGEAVFFTAPSVDTSVHGGVC